MDNNNIINIIHNKNSASRKTALLLNKMLTARNFIVSNTYNHNAKLNICIGGDGAFLRSVHKYNFSEIPFVGVNTGHLGFYQEISPDNLEYFVDDYSNGRYQIEKINLVEALICTNNNCIDVFGINEIGIKGSNSKTVHLDITIDGNHLERFSGDGLIISTPMGSTAYNYSSGGSIVYPSLKALQITPLSPLNSNAYRSLTSSIIVPPDTIVEIEPEYKYESSILIISDGKQYSYENITSLTVKISDMTINMLKLGDNNFWSKIKDKFL